MKYIAVINDMIIATCAEAKDWHFWPRMMPPFVPIQGRIDVKELKSFTKSKKALEKEANKAAMGARGAQLFKAWVEDQLRAPYNQSAYISDTDALRIVVNPALPAKEDVPSKMS